MIAPERYRQEENAAEAIFLYDHPGGRWERATPNERALCRLRAWKIHGRRGVSEDGSQHLSSVGEAQASAKRLPPRDQTQGLPHE